MEEPTKNLLCELKCKGAPQLVTKCQQEHVQTPIGEVNIAAYVMQLLSDVSEENDFMQKKNKHIFVLERLVCVFQRCMHIIRQHALSCSVFNFVYLQTVPVLLKCQCMNL